MPTDPDALSTIITTSGIMFGFFFVGFWWTLERELKFDVEGRHLKLGVLLLFAAMVVLSVLGIMMPLHRLAELHPELQWPYRGMAIALVGIFGYMLTELGHHRVFQFPKYITASEAIFFFLTLAAATVLALAPLF
jgi:hypothetical protein